MESISIPPNDIFKVGDRIQLTVRVNLGSLTPEDVSLELYHGTLSSKGLIENAQGLEMKVVNTENGIVEYSTEIHCIKTGRQAYTVRVKPHHPSLVHSYLPGFILWG